MDFPCDLQNCTSAAKARSQRGEWTRMVDNADQARAMADDLLSVCALSKCIWSVTSITCTRKCSWPVVWLLFMEVVQGLSFGLKLVDWPMLFLNSRPRTADEFEVLMDLECRASLILSVILSSISLVQCIDEALMLRREAGNWKLRGIVQALPLLVILLIWCIWIITVVHGKSDYRAVPILSLFISLMCFCSACCWSWAALHRAKNGAPCATCGCSSIEPNEQGEGG